MQEAIIGIGKEENSNVIAKVLSEEYTCVGNETDIVRLLFLCEEHRPYILILDTSVFHEELWHIIKYVRKEKLAEVIIVVDNDYLIDSNLIEADEIDGILQDPINPKGIMPTILMAVAREKIRVEKEKAFNKLRQELHIKRVNEFSINKLRELNNISEDKIEDYINSLGKEYGKSSDEILDFIYTVLGDNRKETK